MVDVTITPTTDQPRGAPREETDVVHYALGLKGQVSFPPSQDGNALPHRLPRATLNWTLCHTILGTHFKPNYARSTANWKKYKESSTSQRKNLGKALLGDPLSCRGIGGGGEGGPQGALCGETSRLTTRAPKEATRSVETILPKLPTRAAIRELRSDPWESRQCYLTIVALPKKLKTGHPIPERAELSRPPSDCPLINPREVSETPH
ncbi:hypothetical protein BHM03_00015522 [Ensete ventricosum]|nr:hypothetical protein BHM03_00015522 [Ensete ventricosum]